MKINIKDGDEPKRNNMKDIVFVISSRDYHAMDWYRIVKNICITRNVFILTDLVEGEGVERLIAVEDKVLLLFPSDKFLFSELSILGNLWRNFMKLITLPIIAFRLNSLNVRMNKPIFHAHSMYYIVLCWLARVPFIGTPMGSDVLVRTDQSIIYRYFATKALKAADTLTVDSVALQEKILKLCAKKSYLIQNGIDSKNTEQFCNLQYLRNKIVSVRGLDYNYRILDIIKSRNCASNKVPIELIYPYHDIKYKNSVTEALIQTDIDHGRVSKEKMYEIFSRSALVISIPESDSSPRSVYEAIFCGCCVAVSYDKWIETLPQCMRSRIFVADLSSLSWFDEALTFAKCVVEKPFIPSEEAIRSYDEIEAIKVVCQNFYGELI